MIVIIITLKKVTKWFECARHVIAESFVPKVNVVIIIIIYISIMYFKVCNIFL
jgi:hypothetical protein